MAELALMVAGLSILIGFVVWVAKQSSKGSETQKDVAEKKTVEVQQSQRQMGNYRARGGLRGAVRRGVSDRER